MRERVELATKFGISYVDGKRRISGDPAYVRAACEGSLKRLDVDCIDLYYQHRIDTSVPIEVTVGSASGFKFQLVCLSFLCFSVSHFDWLNGLWMPCFPSLCFKKHIILI